MASMGSAPHRILIIVCVVLMVITVANAASGEVASVVMGLAKCTDCMRKNMKAEAAFKGLKVAIKCKNSNGEYESKAAGELQSSGAFSVPVSVELHGADCLAQLHNAEGTPCPGQEPSRINPLPDGSFVVVPGKKLEPSAVCASVTFCGPIMKPFFDYFHKKPVPQEPEPQPQPQPEKPPTPKPSNGSPTPPAMYHFFDNIDKKPVPLEPTKPEPKPQLENHSPTLPDGQSN